MSLIELQLSFLSLWLLLFKFLMLPRAWLKRTDISALVNLYVLPFVVSLASGMKSKSDGEISLVVLFLLFWDYFMSMSRSL